MATVYACQRCTRLPPPPPMFSIGPPPNILSIEVHCSSRLLSPSSIQHKKITSSSSVSVALGIVIVLLIFTGTILLIKNRMVKRRQGRKGKCNDKMMVTSSTVKFNGHNNNHHQQQNWTNFIPLLSDSCSSDHTSSTPPSEYPCGVIEPLLTNDLHHEYEQIKYDDSSHYYCLVYCRQCANYHQTSSSGRRPCYLPLSTNSSCQHQCTCHIRNDNRLFELQPMLITRTEDDSNHHLPI